MPQQDLVSAAQDRLLSRRERRRLEVDARIAKLDEEAAAMEAKAQAAKLAWLRSQGEIAIAQRTLKQAALLAYTAANAAAAVPQQDSAAASAAPAAAAPAAAAAPSPRADAAAPDADELLSAAGVARRRDAFVARRRGRGSTVLALTLTLTLTLTQTQTQTRTRTRTRTRARTRTRTRTRKRAPTRCFPRLPRRATAGRRRGPRGPTGLWWRGPRSRPTTAARARSRPR